VAVTQRTLTLQNALADQLRQLNDQQIRRLVAAWATAWDEVAPDLNATLVEMLVAGDKVTKAQLLRSERLRKALSVIAANLRELATEAGVVITGDLAQVIDTAGSAQSSIIDSQLPPGAVNMVEIDAWSRVDEQQIAAIVRRSTEQITSLTRPLSREAYAAVRRELIRGVASGSNPRVTARRIVQRAEHGFNGGLTRALTIARTETLDAHRAAAQVAQAQHADVLQGWQWLARLDTRTCPSCWAQHGSVHTLDEQGPNDHQQGRCARMPLTKSWADLGFDVVEPASLIPDSRQIFAGLTPAQQLEVLGPGRHAAYAAGEFPMDAWSVKRSTPGWRDSHVAARVPQSGGRTSRKAA
jgi:SPP1 gp7 family putative phage head morphogenesis protein